MPRKHCRNFPDIAQEKSRANIEQKDKILRNMDITNYFGPSEGDKLDGWALNSTMPGASLASMLSATRKVNNLEEREEVKKEKESVVKKI